MPTRLPADIEAYRRDILLGLACVPIAATRQATGLSRGYCKRICVGKAIVYVSHWPALSALVRRADTTAEPHD